VLSSLTCRMLSWPQLRWQGVTIWMPDGVPRMPVAELQKYRNNSRTHSKDQIAKLAAHIQEVGFTDPIGVADGVILTGEGRLLAAMELCMAVVPVVNLDHLTPTQRRLHVIRHNRLAELAGWDHEILREEFAALEIDGVELDELGWDEDELAAIMHVDGVDDEKDEEPEEEPPAGSGGERLVPLAIVLSPEELRTWKAAKEVVGMSTDKAAFLKVLQVFEEAQP
jgi:ParB-like chromosome segregation protein Spo0J